MWSSIQITYFTLVFHLLFHATTICNVIFYIFHVLNMYALASTYYIKCKQLNHMKSYVLFDIMDEWQVENEKNIKAWYKTHVNNTTQWSTKWNTKSGTEKSNYRLKPQRESTRSLFFSHRSRKATWRTKSTDQKKKTESHDYNHVKMHIYHTSEMNEPIYWF